MPACEPVIKLLSTGTAPIGRTVHLEVTKRIQEKRSHKKAASKPHSSLANMNNLSRERQFKMSEHPNRSNDGFAATPNKIRADRRIGRN